MKKVFIEGGKDRGSGVAFAKMFIKNHFLVTNWLNEASLVVLRGGADVNPKLYGQDRNFKTHFDNHRDEQDTTIYNRAVNLKIPIAGICRGAQFLNVMNGGQLHQHVDGHATGKLHDIFDEDIQEPIPVTSTHHQMMVPHEDGKLIAWGKEATYHENGSEVKYIREKSQVDPEVVWYEKTKCLCFQPHPEYLHEETEKYFFDLLDRYIFKDEKVTN